MRFFDSFSFVACHPRNSLNSCGSYTGRGGRSPRSLRLFQVIQFAFDLLEASG